MSTLPAILYGAARALTRNLARKAAGAKMAAQVEGQTRDLTLVAALCRRRKQTKQTEPTHCDHCEEPPHPLCHKKHNCLDPQPKCKCPPLRRCKTNACAHVDSRAIKNEREAGEEVERQQMAQARMERRMRKCHNFRREHCPKKKKKKEHNVYSKHCPKDYSDKRR